MNAGHALHVYDAVTGALEHEATNTSFRGAADLTGDGRLELVVAVRRDLAILDGDGYGELARIRDAGFRNWNHPRYADGHLTRISHRHQRSTEVYQRPQLATVFGDVDGDGVLDVVTRARDPEALAVSLAGGEVRELWRVPLAEGFHVAMDAVGDLDGDGRGETVVQLADGALVVVDDDGGERARVENRTRVVNPQVADLDFDGTPEILLTTATGPGPLDVVRVRDGVPEVTRIVDSGVDGSYRFAPYPVDLDRDGTRELVVSHARGVAALRADGSEIWRQEGTFYAVAVGRFDAQPGMDVVAQRHGGGHDAWSGTTGERVWRSEASFEYGPGVVDLDGDGCDDIIATTATDSIHATSGCDGSLLFLRRFEPISASGTMLAADLDGDGADEFVSSGNYDTATVEANGTRLWADRLTTEGNKNHFGTVLDVDGDGGLDLVQPNNKGVFAVDGKTGRELWRFQHEPRVAFGSAVVADVDGDGEEEILVASKRGGALRAGPRGSRAVALRHGRPDGCGRRGGRRRRRGGRDPGLGSGRPLRARAGGRAGPAPAPGRRSVRAAGRRDVGLGHRAQPRQRRRGGAVGRRDGGRRPAAQRGSPPRGRWPYLHRDGARGWLGRAHRDDPRVGPRGDPPAGAGLSGSAGCATRAVTSRAAPAPSPPCPLRRPPCPADTPSPARTAAPTRPGTSATSAHR